MFETCDLIVSRVYTVVMCARARFSKNLGAASDHRTKPGTLPKIGAGRLGSGRSSASSAKQHYLSKSRYVPGEQASYVGVGWSRNVYGYW